MRQFKVKKIYAIETEIIVSARSVFDAVEAVDDVDFQRMSELRDCGEARVVNIDEYTDDYVDAYIEG